MLPKLDWEGGVDNGLYAAMADAMAFWVAECGIDGYRCDVAMKVPTPFWDMARRQLEAVNPDVFMLAEAEEPDHHNRAFDMSYGWHFHHLTNQVAQGKSPFQVLRDYLEEEAERFPSDAYRMGFITNHDENSWNGTVEERYGDAGDAMGVLAATLLDMPLVYSGQESFNTERLRFFEKDTVQWGAYSKTEFYPHAQRAEPFPRSPLERRLWWCPRGAEDFCRRACLCLQEGEKRQRCGGGDQFLGRAPTGVFRPA